MLTVVGTDEAIRAGQAAEHAGDYLGAAAAFGSLLDSEDPRTGAAARCHLGRVAWKQGRLDEALELCESARSLALRTDDVDLRAGIENAIGVLHVARGEYAQARAVYAVALDLTRDAVTRAKITLNLGVIANIQGSQEVARRHYASALGMFRDASDARGEALALHNLGMLHADRAEWEDADDLFRSALALFESEQNRQMIANVLVNRSEVGYGRGRTHDALAQCDLALTIYSELGDEVGRGETLRWKGHGLRLLGRLAEADQAISESIRIAERTRTRLLEAEGLRELGHTRRAGGDVHGARLLLERALALFRELGAQREAEQLTVEIDA